MRLRKKIKFKKYLLLSTVSLLIIIILSDKSQNFIISMILLVFATIINQWILLFLLEKLFPPEIYRPFKLSVTQVIRRCHGAKNGRFRSFRSFRVNSGYNYKRYVWIFRASVKRRIKKIQEKEMYRSSRDKLELLKIVGFFFLKTIILLLAISLGIHLIGNRIILGLMQYVLQIFFLAVSIRK